MPADAVPSSAPRIDVPLPRLEGAGPSIDLSRVPDPPSVGGPRPASSAGIGSLPGEPGFGTEPPSEFGFDQAARISHSDQPVPPGGVPRALREAAEAAGLDPLAELYNEALRYASEGHLRLARERLQMLLCMAPDDGEARLVLAKVHVAGQRWQEALAALDEAQSCGVTVPPTLRRAVEEHLRAEEAAADEHRAALRAREQGEIKALRLEARRLRSENAQFVSRSAALEQEIRKWAWTTVGVATLSIAFIVGNLLFGGRAVEAESLAAAEPPPTTTETRSTTATLPAATPAQRAASPAESPADLAARAAAALSATPGLEGTSLQVEVSLGKARISGEVLAHAQLSSARQILAGVPGIQEVDASAVQVVARTRGTRHTVKSGDTPYGMAQYYYGDATRSRAILEANRGVTPSNLRIGQELVIPPVR